jgi:hypothetical protein
LGVQVLKEGTAVTNDDLIFRHRMRLFARAGGGVRLLLEKGAA